MVAGCLNDLGHIHGLDNASDDIIWFFRELEVSGVMDDISPSLG